MNKAWKPSLVDHAGGGRSVNKHAQICIYIYGNMHYFGVSFGGPIYHEDKWVWKGVSYSWNVPNSFTSTSTYYRKVFLFSELHLIT